MAKQVHLGWIGLGQMGAPMAERLLGEDVTLHVFDIAPAAVEALVAKGAVAHRTPREVADAARIVFACLPSRGISEAVAFGPGGVAEGQAVRVHVEMSTIGRTCIQTIENKLAPKGIAVVDAPITGGPPAAREGRLTMMHAGAADAAAQVAPWLARIGAKVVDCGDTAGQAQIMKLVNNLVMATNVVVAAEGLVMGAKAGLDPETMFDVLGAGTGASRALTELLKETALSGRFDFGAHLSIIDKDVTLGVGEADALHVPVPVIAAAGAIWRAAAEDGLGADDFTRITEWIERCGGASLRRRRPGAD